jgi:hypothetical protein
MRSFFSRLQYIAHSAHSRVEDFQTEIVAHVFRNSEPFLRKWLSSLNVKLLGELTFLEVYTQETFAALDDQTLDSRPDIVIKATNKVHQQLIFIESKIDADEGWRQLERYAKILGEWAGEDRSGVLIYITRDFEERKNVEISKYLSFMQSRWFEFYRTLKDFEDLGLMAKELLLFAEENKMTLGNQFSVTDLAALSGFRSVERLMAHTISDEVSTLFAKTFGDVTNRKKALGLLESGQYGLYQGFGSWDFSCLLGYWLPESETTTFANLGFCYYSNPKSSIHNVTETAFRSFASGRSHWETADLGSLKTWSTLSCRKRLNAFVGAEDQVKAIKGFFSDCLREANEFKSANPSLPWNKHKTDDPEEP